MAAMQEELVTETESIRAETRAIQTRTEARLPRMDANMKCYQAKTEASHKEFLARIDANREMTEEPLKEENPASVDTKPEAAQQEEVPVEDVIVILVEEPEEGMTSQYLYR
jgi:hypothetical protein